MCVAVQMLHKNKIIEDLTASVKRLAVGATQQSSAAQGRPFSCGEAAIRVGQASAPEAGRASSHAHAGQRSTGPGSAGCCNPRTRVDIPHMPVSKTCTSIDNVWKEYAEGTESKPAIRRLIEDHGNEWKKSCYGYDRKYWHKKKKIISALEALQDMRSISADKAVAFLTKLAGKQVNGFADSLPKLDDEVDVSGLCKSSSGEWRRLQAGDDQYGKYSEYMKELKEFVKQKQSVRII